MMLTYCGLKMLSSIDRTMTLTHIYNWGNNDKRRTLKGRKCRIVSSGVKGSRLIEFEDGQREIVS